MKRVLLPATFAFLGIAVTIAFCQPPAGVGQQGPGPDRMGSGFGPPPNPVLEALDADGNHEISAEEIKSAAASLKQLDKNNDGKLTHEELHPQMPGGRPALAPQGESQGPGMQRPGGPGMQRPGGPGMQGADGGFPQGGRRGMQVGRGMQRRGGPGMEGPGEGRHQRRPGGPPSPDEFVEHAMQFDADQDGKLSEDELRKLAEQMAQGPPPGGQPGRPGDRADDQRPARPQRPASE